MSAIPLSDTEIKQQAPSIFAETAYQDVSDRYYFVPTHSVVNLFRQSGWYPIQVKEGYVRNSAKEGYQKHVVRFRHVADLLDSNKEYFPEVLLTNSHDRSTHFQISSGLYRLICKNGLCVLSDKLQEHRIKHLGYKEDDVLSAIHSVANGTPLLLDQVKEFQSLTLTSIEQNVFAQAASRIRFDPQEVKVNPQDLLHIHREADSRHDLFTILNVIQENLISGGYQATNRQTGKSYKTKPIQAIDRDIQINQKLWQLGEKLALMKSHLTPGNNPSFNSLTPLAS